VDTTFTGGRGGVTANLLEVPSIRGMAPPIDIGEVVYPVLGSGFFVNVDALIQLPRPLEADGVPMTQTDIVIVGGPVEVMRSGPIRPILGMARDLRVNGIAVQPAPNGDPKAVLASGFGLTPTITWQPPSLGMPSKYTVTFTSFAQTPDNITFVTTDPTLRIPPGALKSGVAYTVSVRADMLDATGRGGLALLNSGVVRP
jgi:hypothetical protein